MLFLALVVAVASALPVSELYKGTLSLAAAQQRGQANVGTAAPLSRSVLIFTYSAAAGTPATNLIRGRFVSPGVVEFGRGPCGVGGSGGSD